jgi:hypothetical protein
MDRARSADLFAAPARAAALCHQSVVMLARRICYEPRADNPAKPVDPTHSLDALIRA